VQFKLCTKNGAYLFSELTFSHLRKKATDWLERKLDVVLLRALIGIEAALYFSFSLYFNPFFPQH
jgi:hypothetical protein